MDHLALGIRVQAKESVILLLKNEGQRIRDINFPKEQWVIEIINEYELNSLDTDSLHRSISTTKLSVQGSPFIDVGMGSPFVELLTPTSQSNDEFEEYWDFT